MNLIQHFVNGKIISGKSERRGKVFNPAIGEQESEVILGLKSDLDEVEHIMDIGSDCPFYTCKIRKKRCWCFLF